MDVYICFPSSVSTQCIRQVTGWDSYPSANNDTHPLGIQIHICVVDTSSDPSKPTFLDVSEKMSTEKWVAKSDVVDSAPAAKLDTDLATRIISLQVRKGFMHPSSLILFITDCHEIHPVIRTIRRRASDHTVSNLDKDVFKKIFETPLSAWVMNPGSGKKERCLETMSDISVGCGHSLVTKTPSLPLIAFSAGLAVLQEEHQMYSIESTACAFGGGRHFIRSAKSSANPDVLLNAEDTYRLFHAQVRAGLLDSSIRCIHTLYVVTGELGEVDRINRHKIDTKKWCATTVFKDIESLFANQSVRNKLHLHCVAPNECVGDELVRFLKNAMTETRVGTQFCKTIEAFRQGRLRIAFFASKVAVPWAYHIAYARDSILRGTPQGPRHSMVNIGERLRLEWTVFSADNTKDAKKNIRPKNVEIPTHIILLREGVQLESSGLENLWMSRKYGGASSWLGQVLSDSGSPSSCTTSPILSDPHYFYSFKAPPLDRILQKRGLRCNGIDRYHVAHFSMGSVVDTRWLSAQSHLWSIVQNALTQSSIEKHDGRSNECRVTEADVALSCAIHVGWPRWFLGAHAEKSLDDGKKNSSERRKWIHTLKHSLVSRIWRCFGSPPIKFSARLDRTFLSDVNLSPLLCDASTWTESDRGHIQGMAQFPFAKIAAHMKNTIVQSLRCLSRTFPEWDHFISKPKILSTGRKATGAIAPLVTYQSSAKERKILDKSSINHTYNESGTSRTLIVYYDEDVVGCPIRSNNTSDLIMEASLTASNQVERLWKPMEASGSSCSLLFLCSSRSRNKSFLSHPGARSLLDAARVARISGTVSFDFGPTSEDSAKFPARSEKRHALSIRRWCEMTRITQKYITQTPPNDRPTQVILIRGYPMWCNIFWPKYLSSFISRYNDVSVPDYGDPFSGGVDFRVVCGRPWILQSVSSYLLPRNTGNIKDLMSMLKSKVAKGVSKKYSLNARQLFKQALCACQAVLFLMPIPYSRIVWETVQLPDDAEKKSSKEPAYSAHVDAYVMRRGTNMNGFSGPRVGYRSRAWYHSDRVRKR